MGKKQATAHTKTVYAQRVGFAVVAYCRFDYCYIC